nr:hypothetical protein [Tanacetum cinerariifolium]
MIIVLVISSSSPKAKKMKSLECKFLRSLSQTILGMHLTTTLTWKWLQSMIIKLQLKREERGSKGKGIATDEHVAQSLLDLYKPEKKSTTYQFLLQRRTLATEEESTRPYTQPEDDTSANIVRDTPSPIDVETSAITNKTNSEGDIVILNVGEEQGEYVAKKVDLDEKTAEINEGQTGTNPDTEPMHDEFVATVYPQLHESLKHPDEEHFHLENPLRSTGTLSSMKNMDAYSFSDQFFNDKLIEEDLRKINMDFKVESMVTILIHQASSSIPLLSTPTIETKTTTLPPPPP